MARPVRATWSFPRSARLLRRSDFVRLRVAPGMTQGPLAANWAPKAPDATRTGMAAATARVGLVVSAKVGGAVQRNRVKRRLREAVRHELHRFPAVDVVLVARASAAAATVDELRAWLRRLAARVVDGEGAAS